MKNKLTTKIGKLRLSSQYLDFGKVRNTETKTIVIKIQNADENDMVLRAENLPDYLQIKELPEILKPKEIYYVKFILEPQNLYGKILETILFESKVKQEKKVIKLRFQANIVEDFSYLTPIELENAPIFLIEKQKINIGSIKRNEERVFEIIIQNNGKRDLIIRKLETGRRFTVSDFKKQLINGAKSKIKITLKASFLTSDFSETFQIISNDPHNPIVEITVFGKIIK